MNGIILASQSGNLNINIDSKTLDMCVKSIGGWGYTTYQNICNGQTATVIMGVGDWIFVSLGIALGLLLVLFLAIVIFKIAFD